VRCRAGRAQNIQELYNLARGYDAAYQSARAQAESTIYRAEQTRALNRPLVTGTAAAVESRSDTPYATNLSTRISQQQIGVTAAQSLVQPHQRPLRSTRPHANIEIAARKLQAAEQDLIVRLVQAYFDVLSASDALGTVRASKKAISEQLASAKRNFEVGTATITDTREAQARFDLATAQELAAEKRSQRQAPGAGQRRRRADVEPKAAGAAGGAAAAGGRSTPTPGSTRATPPARRWRSCGWRARSPVSRPRRRAPATCPRSASTPRCPTRTRAPAAARAPGLSGP